MTEQVETTLTGNPYVGPRTFKESESNLFFGREQEARDLLSLVISEPLVLFCAQSGAGKSSLLNARLIPELRRKGFTVLPVGRVGSALPPDLESIDNVFIFNLLLGLDQGRREPGQLSQLTLSQYLRQSVVERTVEEPVDGEGVAVPSRVLIIDQFEEILTTHLAHWDERVEFFRQLNQAIVDDDQLWVVLTLREDYVAALTPYANIMQDRMRARFYMQRMQVRAALEAVREPAAAARRPFAAGVAEALVDNLRQMHTQSAQRYLGQFVEPVQLQVVCYQLWENLKEKPAAAITQPDLDELGNVDTALGEFYEATVSAVMHETGVTAFQLRNWFDQYLITEAGTRGTVYQGAEETGGLDNRVVRQLADRFLLRAEIRAGGTWYELIHDRFVTPILQANQVWRLQQSPLIRAAEEWERSGRRRSNLYQGEQLKQALATVDRETVEPLVRQFLDASEAAQSQRDLADAQAEAAEQAKRAEAEARIAGRLRRISTALSVIVKIGVAATVIALAASLAASIQQGNAERASSNAIAQQASAEVASTRLLREQLTAEAASTRAHEHEGTAVAARNEVDAQRATAVAASTYAFEQKSKAEAASTRAIEQEAIAEAAREEARAQQQEAEAARQQSELGRRRLLVQALAFQAINLVQSSNDTELATLLLLHANNTREQLREAGILTADEAASLEATLEEAAAPILQRPFYNVTLQGHAGAILALAFSLDGQSLISAGADGTIRIWPLTGSDTGAEIMTGNQETTDLMSTTPDGRLLAAANISGTIQIWSLHDLSAPPIQLQDETSAILSLALSPDGERLAVSTDERIVRLWYLDEAEPRAVTLPHVNPDRFHDLLFGPDSRTFYALAPSEGRDFIYTWDVTLNVNTARSYLPIAFSPDGQMAAYIKPNPEDVTPPNQYPVTDAFNAFFRSEENDLTLTPPVSFSPNNDLLAEAHEHGIRLWTLDSGSRVASLTHELAGQTGTITVMRFSPEGRILASASDDGTIRLWWPNSMATFDELLDVGCEQVKRNLTWDEWQAFIKEQQYQQTCPQLPVHESVPEEQVSNQ